MDKLIWNSVGISNTGDLFVKALTSDGIDSNVVEFEIHQSDGYKKGVGHTLEMAMQTCHLEGLIKALQECLEHKKGETEHRRKSLKDQLERLD